MVSTISCRAITSVTIVDQNSVSHASSSMQLRRWPYLHTAVTGMSTGPSNSLITKDVLQKSQYPELTNADFILLNALLAAFL